MIIIELIAAAISNDLLKWHYWFRKTFGYMMIWLALSLLIFAILYEEWLMAAGWVEVFMSIAVHQILRSNINKKQNA